MRRKRCYISGWITGNPNYLEDFSSAAVLLKARGFDPVNPAVKEVPGWGWKDYIRYDIPLLCGCDCIYLLPNWRNSKGAKLERYIARKLEMEFIK